MRISHCTTATVTAAASCWSVLGGAGPAMAFATAVPSAVNRPITTTTISSRRLSPVSDVRSSSTSLHALPSPLAILRGGASTTGAEALAETFLDSSLGQVLSSTFTTATPAGLFNGALAALALTTVGIRTAAKLGGGDDSKSESSKKEDKPKEIKSLQIKFLSVFWLLRLSDWLQGPYFYEVYASKIFNGGPATLSMISQLFLTGFASTALFGPLVGRLSDQYGRKLGTLAFCMLYSLGAASTKSPLLWVLLLGRVMSGIGTSLLFSAPEAWLVGEAMEKKKGGDYLGETFGLAYAGDSIVAIVAGQLAGAAAGARGPTGPFELSTGFLVAGGLLTSLLWKENKAEPSAGDDGKEGKQPTIRDAIQVIKEDKKIALVGATQALFEAAMYVFVLQWPPAISKAIGGAFGAGAATPYGKIFSCFMAACLLGSTIFGQLISRGVATESFMAGMLAIGTLAMGLATYASHAAAAPLALLVAGFFVFEACVGCYFPSIGTLRGKYLPDSHRSTLMNLFGIPLNALVVTVFLGIKKLGVSGALSVSTGALGVATASMLALKKLAAKEESDKAEA